jgi:hypothetical protein
MFPNLKTKYIDLNPVSLVMDLFSTWISFTKTSFFPRRLIIHGSLEVEFLFANKLYEIEYILNDEWTIDLGWTSALRISQQFTIFSFHRAFKDKPTCIVNSIKNILLLLISRSKSRRLAHG